MNRRASRLPFFALAPLLAVSALVTACSGEESPTTAAVAEQQRTAGTLPIPGAQPEGELPPGHPPLEGGAGGDLHWEVPAGWIEQTPSSSMRVAQFAVEGSGGAAEMIVFYFGPNQGGDAMANARRWAGQFTQPDGTSSVDRMQVSRVDGSQLPVQIVEVSGTYDGGMTMTDAPAKAMEGYTLLGGIAEGPDAPWFFKFTGPEATVREQREAFIGMMRTLHPGH